MNATKTRRKKTPKMKSSNISKTHLVVGKIYSNGCIHCVMMSKPWEDMIEQIKHDMNLSLEKETHGHLKQYQKYVSLDGNSIVEVIEIESDNMERELPYIQKEFSPKIDLQGGFPTLFKMRDNQVSYYGGERTAEKMKEWYSKREMQGGRRITHRRRHNKTKKNKTRTRYTR